VRIARVQTYPLFLSKEDADNSYAGDSAIAHRGYMIKPPWRSLYSPGYETLLVKVETDDGLVGWGEALAPVAPEVTAAIVDHLLAPLIIGEDPQAVRVLWHRMSESMRERGHLGRDGCERLAPADEPVLCLAADQEGLVAARVETAPRWLDHVAAVRDRRLARVGVVGVLLAQEQREGLDAGDLHCRLHG